VTRGHPSRPLVPEQSGFGRVLAAALGAGAVFFTEAGEVLALDDIEPLHGVGEAQVRVDARDHDPRVATDHFGQAAGARPAQMAAARLPRYRSISRRMTDRFFSMTFAMRPLRMR